MKNNSSNKRRHRRFNVDVLDMKSNVVFVSDILIRDISITGVSVVSGHRLEVGREYSLRIMDMDLDFTIQGTAIWSTERAADDNAGDKHLKYAAGLQFARLEQHNVQELIRFIELHLIEKHTQVRVHDMSGSRYNIRFNVDRSETAVLNVEETYRVKKLSLGGMLVESSRALEPDTRLHMELSVPSYGAISFTGRITSCMPAADSASCSDIGIEFVEISGQDRAALKQLIRALYLENSGFSAA